MLPVFYVAVLHVQKHFVKKEILQRFKHEQYVTLLIPVENIRWHQPGEEILIEGLLFDVESISYHNNIATVNGLYDCLETDLDREISEAQAGKQNSESSLNNILAKILAFFFIETEPAPGNLNVAAEASMKPPLRHYADNLLYNYISVPTPPPLS